MEDPLPPEYTSKVKKNEVVGWGCVVQGVGLILTCYFLFAALTDRFNSKTPLIIAGVIFLATFVGGSLMSVKWLCGYCKNKLESKDVTQCHVCGCHFR